MGDEDDGPVGEHPAQRLPQGRGDGDVERGHRLVEQQQPGVGGERAGHRDPLGLPAGELAGAPVGELGDADLLEPACGAARAPYGGAAPRAARAEGDVVEHAQVREEQRVLGEQRDPPGVRRRPRTSGGRSSGRPPSSTTRPRVGRAAGRRRRPAAVDLPGAVGAEHGDGLAVGDLERDVDVALGDLGASARGVTRCSVPAGRSAITSDGDHHQHERQGDGGVGVGLARR